MKPFNRQDVVFTWALAVLIVAALGCAHYLDHDEVVTYGLSDAQKQAQTEARRDRAAAELCFKTAGYGSAPTWNDRGELVCRRHDGRGKGVKVSL